MGFARRVFGVLDRPPPLPPALVLGSLARSHHLGTVSGRRSRRIRSRIARNSRLGTATSAFWKITSGRVTTADYSVVKECMNNRTPTKP